MLAEIKRLKNTLILQNKESFWQEVKEIREYVEENCTKIDEIRDIEVFYKE